MFVLLIRVPENGLILAVDPEVGDGGVEIGSLAEAAKRAAEGCPVVDLAGIPPIVAHALLGTAIPDPRIPNGQRAQCPKGHFHVSVPDWVRLASQLPRVRVGEVRGGAVKWTGAAPAADEEDLPGGLRVNVPAGRA